MQAGGDALQEALYQDLATIADSLTDDDVAADLCRALAGNEWRKREARGHVSLDFDEARQIVNRLRDRVGRPPLDLAPGEGTHNTGDAIEYALSSLGWRTDIALSDRPASPDS
jgi:hypothetical protein